MKETIFRHSVNGDGRDLFGRRFWIDVRDRLTPMIL